MSNRVLPRKHEFEVEPSMILRPRNPDDHRQFAEILPWFTPLYVWEGKGCDWVRWSVPQDMAKRMGIDGNCACCGKDNKVKGDHDDVLVDTAWHETDWWLEANGYSNPGAPKVGAPTPTKEEGTSP